VHLQRLKLQFGVTSITHVLRHFRVTFYCLCLFRKLEFNGVVKGVMSGVVQGVYGTTPITHVFRHFRVIFCCLRLSQEKLVFKGVVKGFYVTTPPYS